jgi:hypothetical protein
VALVTEVSTPRKYDVFSVLFPESFRVIKVREAAYVARPRKLLLLEGNNARPA